MNDKAEESVEAEKNRSKYHYGLGEITKKKTPTKNILNPKEIWFQPILWWAGYPSQESHRASHTFVGSARGPKNQEDPTSPKNHHVLWDYNHQNEYGLVMVGLFLLYYALFSNIIRITELPDYACI